MYIINFIYMYILIICYCCTSNIAKDQPFGWEHANLDDLRQFLRDEITAGRYVPVNSNIPL